MAAVTTAVVGATASGFQIYQGVKQNQEAKDALNNFERQDLTNIAENRPISTLGSNLISEENSRIASTQVEAARGSGIRGIMGAIPRIQQQNNLQNRQAQNYLDQQVIDRQRAIESDNRRIQGMQEQRDNADLAGIGQQLQTGTQNTFNGIRGLLNTSIYAANNIDFSSNETTKDLDGLPDKQLGINNQIQMLGTGIKPPSLYYNNNMALDSSREIDYLNEVVPKNFG